jgi:hypothetical protein
MQGVDTERERRCVAREVEPAAADDAGVGHGVKRAGGLRDDRLKAPRVAGGVADREVDPDRVDGGADLIRQLSVNELGLVQRVGLLRADELPAALLV